MNTSSHYHFVRELGAGAMGRVSLVHHEISGQLYALKRMNDHVAASGGARMRQEFRSLAQINHPNVVRVFEFGEENQKPFLVMEYVQGQDMSEWIGTNPDFTTISQVFAGIADGLSAVHAQGLIHRDLKPENIRITPDGQAKIMDFGLVKVLEGSVAITKAGAMVGTALYMSPEQCRGYQLDYRADLYALGVVLYWALTKVHPFRGDTIIEVVLQHVQQMPIPPRTHNQNIPESLEKICLALLSKKPTDRPSSAEAVQLQCLKNRF
jgi:eukaryotic-like serine/threonine-protein kinase